MNIKFTHFIAFLLAVILLVKAATFFKAALLSFQVLQDDIELMAEEAGETSKKANAKAFEETLGEALCNHHEPYLNMPVAYLSGDGNSHFIKEDLSYVCLDVQTPPPDILL